MKVGKWHIDFKDSQYWVYNRKVVDKKTGKEYPDNTSYFNTLAGALRNVRHELIGTKIGRDKEDDISEIIAQIATIDAYIVERLEITPKTENVGA